MTVEDIHRRLEAVMTKLDSKTAEAIQSNLPLAGPLAAMACELAGDLSSLRLDLMLLDVVIEFKQARAAPADLSGHRRETAP